MANATATTNASGGATAGTWTMGAAEGPQVLRATAGTWARVQIRAIARFPTVVVTTQTLGPAGGTLTVNQPGSPLNGATIQIPDGAVMDAMPITLSITSTAGIVLRDGATAVGPAMNIASIATRLNKPAIVRVPAPADTSTLYILAAYDPATGSFTVLPPVQRMGNSLAAVLPALDVSMVPQVPVSTRTNATRRATTQDATTQRATTQSVTARTAVATESTPDGRAA